MGVACRPHGEAGIPGGWIQGIRHSMCWGLEVTVTSMTARFLETEGVSDVRARRNGRKFRKIKWLLQMCSLGCL